MGFWFSNFQQFEEKETRENRLILNFYYVPDNGEEARSAKVFLKQNIRIPTGFIYHENIETIKKFINEDEELNKFNLDERKFGDFSIFSIEIPYDKRLLDKLPDKFQTGNYDKLLKFWFWPENKFAFSKGLEERLLNENEIEVDSLEAGKDYWVDFLKEDDLKQLPTLYWDIEKPLWKNEDEKKILKARKRVLKLDKKYENKDRKHELRLKTLRVLEDRLIIEVDGVGKVKLWEDKFDSAISCMTLIWDNIGKNKERVKEMYILDPNNELEEKEASGYKVHTFKTEKELLEYFLEKTHEKKAICYIGHNQVYDTTQTRFGLEAIKKIFDPIVKEVQPRRDVVIGFYQRLKENPIFIDSMWLSRIYRSWLQQRSLGTSLKLEAVAQSYGINFKKIMKHEDLRIMEVQRFAGETPEIRKKAREKMLSYSAGDVDAVFDIIQKSLGLALVMKMKSILPYCTLTEIAFSPSCASKYHDKKHFDKYGNNRFYGRKEKDRQNEIDIFHKKRFPSLKNQMLNYAGISTKKIKGVYKNVYEIYLPFEEWIKDPIFKYAPEFRAVYNSVEGEEKFGFLQYLKTLEKEILKDYYFARRENKIFKDYPVEKWKYEKIEKIIEKESLDKLYWYVDDLKRNFRSVYMGLEGKGKKGEKSKRALIRPTKNNLLSISNLFGKQYPKVMEHDTDLYLLREHADEIMGVLSEKNQAILKRFLTNFNRFEELTKFLSKKLGCFENPEEFLLLYNQHKRKEKREIKFSKTYGFSVRNLTTAIDQSYKDLAEEFEKYDVKVLDKKGDYLFVQGDENLKESKLLYLIREFPAYEIKDIKNK